jgi:hypothetical protein
MEMLADRNTLSFLELLSKRQDCEFQSAVLQHRQSTFFSHSSYCNPVPPGPGAGLPAWRPQMQ